MSNPFVAEIRIFTGGFAPVGWALCDGQLMSISQNTALFSLLGTTYGGNGTSTFALPNLQGCAPMQQGQGPGLTQRFLGETGGEQSLNLLTTEMPAHAHVVQGSTNFGAGTDPTSGFFGHSRWFQNSGNKGVVALYNTASGNPVVQMNPAATSIAGGSQPHNNMMPFLGLTFIIALQGVFPPRT